MSNLKNIEKNKKKILIVILTIHLIFVICSMNQPFHGDEAVFYESARGVLRTGKPIFDYSAFKLNFVGLWHSPFYIYILSGFMFILGESVYVLRAISGIFNVLTIILVYLIAMEIFNNKHKEKWSLLAAVLYALNPLTIQSSIPLDIDAGLLNFSMYLFLYFFVKNKSFYYLFPSLFFVFLSKESGPVVLFLSLLLFLILTNWKRIPKIVLLFLISGGVFWGLFWIYCKILNLDILMPLQHNFPFLRESGEVEILISVVRSAWSFKTFFYFAVPFFIALFFIYSFIFYYKYLKTKKIEKNILLINILALITIALYLYFGVTAWGFPKYYITALPAMSIFVVYMISKVKFPKDIFKDKYSLTLISLILVYVLFFYFLVIVSDPLLPEFDSNAENTNILIALRLIGKSFCLYAVIPFLIIIFILKIFKIQRGLIIGLLFLTFFMFLYLNLLHMFVDYSTYYKYGDWGIKETIKYFQKREISAENVATHMHLGEYLGISEYTEISLLYNNETIFKEEIVENPKIDYIIIWERDIERIGENMNYFTLEKKIGSYYIFKKKQNRDVALPVSELPYAKSIGHH